MSFNNLHSYVATAQMRCTVALVSYSARLEMVNLKAHHYLVPWRSPIQVFDRPSAA